MGQHIKLIFSLFFLINIIITILIIILERKRPEKTIAWLLIIVFMPPIGLLFYIFLGRNWKRYKLSDDFNPLVKELINYTIRSTENPKYMPLMKLLGKNSESPVFLNNEITIFKDGIEKFEALKYELLRAKNHIHLEYYIVKNDNIGNEIKDILIQKAQEGVNIKFILDRVGSIKLGKKYIKDLKESGIEVLQYSYFLAPILSSINTQINYRNHRKIVVIDGETSFVGGINIGDEYLGKGELGYWRDTHLMIKGNFTLGLQAIFLDDYITIKKTVKDYRFDDKNIEEYFSPSKFYAGKTMQMVKSGPDSSQPSIMQAIIKMISMAKNHIYITTPYFIPSESIMEALKIASLSGIDVRILFPGQYDHFIVYYASRTYLYELMKCGAKVYFYDKNSFIHAKTITVDGEIASVGTANIDIRSFELNYEINAIIYDEEKTQELERLFEKDLEKSIMIGTDYYENLPRTIKFIEAVTRLFSYLL